MTSYAVNGLNQYSSVGGAAYAYDANGNLTSDAATTWTYDIENRLVKAVAGGVTTNVVYDPLGRLFEYNQGTTASTRRFVTDGDAIINELDGNNALAERFIHGSNAAADDALLHYANAGSGLTQKKWPHADHLGSIVAVTNGSGGSPSINAYDEYGIPQTDATTHNINLNTGRFQYTGQAWIGELGMYYYKARIYSPKLGRFLQTDPIGYEGGINLYGYVEDDPLNAGDPTGLASDCTGARSDTSAGEGVCSGVSGGSTASATGNTKTLASWNAVSSHTGMNGLPQSGPAPRMMHDGDTLAMMQDSIEQDMVMQGQMAQSEHRERQVERGEGALTGAAILDGAVLARSVVRSGLAGLKHAIGPRGPIIGRERLGGKSVLNINSNRYLRFGWGWTGRSGQHTLRISGSVLKQVTGKSHIDLLTLPEWMFP